MIRVLTPNSSPKTFTAYRNIFTAKTSQDLFDDIGDPEDFPVLHLHEDFTAGIDRSIAKKNRVFHYANDETTLPGVFDFIPNHANLGRFNDKDFGIWYGAIDEQTSARESAYWIKILFKEDLAKNSEVMIDRKMFSARIDAGAWIDLCGLEKNHPDLIHREDYSFCRSLGRQLKEEGIESFWTPSVRNEGGICSPILAPDVISEERVLYFLHFTFRSDGSLLLTRDQDEIIAL